MAIADSSGTGPSDAEQPVVFTVVVPVPVVVHVPPSQVCVTVPWALALIFTWRTWFNASTHCCTLSVSTNDPSQKIAPLGCWQTVWQLLAASCLHCVIDDSWQFTWQSTFALAVQDAVQLSWQLVLQSVVVDVVQPESQ